jgi:hypothetical protein
VYGGAPPVITEVIVLEAPEQALPLPVRVAAVGTEPIVITIISLAGRQTPAGSFVVRVRVAVPAVLSAPLGVYTALRVVLFGAKVPAPAEVQVPDTALPPTLPARVTVASAQIDRSSPAFAVAGLFTVIVPFLVMTPHPPVSVIV